jgi:hypothetical protein
VATWAEFEAEAPELAAKALTRLRSHKHLTIATLRRDGSPRISGTECEFADGELTFGAMWHSMKALDLLRDPRFALHSGSDDPPGWDADAKVAGTVRAGVAQTKALGEYHLFTADISEVVVVGLNEARDKLVIEMWHEGRGTSRLER